LFILSQKVEIFKGGNLRIEDKDKGLRLVDVGL
jgi:hypothetical protein